jgi:hypothetical protein
MAAKKNIKELKHEIAELQAQLAHVYAFASSNLPKLSTDKLMASGVFMRLHKIGQTDPIIDVVIRDGLSNRTINSLLDDLSRSYELAILQKPSLKRFEE